MFTPVLTQEQTKTSCGWPPRQMRQVPDTLPGTLEMHIGNHADSHVLRWGNPDQQSGCLALACCLTS